MTPPEAPSEELLRLRREIEEARAMAAWAVRELESFQTKVAEQAMLEAHANNWCHVVLRVLDNLGLGEHPEVLRHRRDRHSPFYDPPGRRFPGLADWGF
jgi:hypothetical protein